MRKIGLIAAAAIVAGGLLAIGSPAYATGTHYYVSSSTGSDTNSGLSTSAPFATLAKASSVLLGAGDRVDLKRGDTWAHQGLLITASGTATDPIVVSHYGTDTERPKITGGVQVSGKKGSCIRVEGDYVNIDNIRTGSTLSGTGSCSDSTTFAYGYGVNALGAHVTVLNSSSEGNAAGYRLVGDYGRVTNSTAHDSREHINTCDIAGDDSGTFGVLVNGDHAEVDHNLFYNNRATSCDYGYDGSDVELFGANFTNVHHNQSTGGSNGFTESGKSGTDTNSDNTFEYNSFVSVGATAADAEAHGITLRGSGSSYGPNERYVIRHNTIVVKYTGSGVADTTQGIGCSASCPSSTVITDNILVASYRAVYDDNAASTVTNNILVGAFDTFTPPASNLFTNPLLVSDTDLHLTGTSPAIDTAATQPYTADVTGATVPQDGDCNGTATADRGAYEYDSPNC